jgi:hypothetical protein
MSHMWTLRIGQFEMVSEGLRLSARRAVNPLSNKHLALANILRI